MKRLRLAYADRVGAGASAEQRYKQLAGTWWARVRWRVLLCILVVPALALIFALLLPRHQELFAGFGLGGTAILYAALRVLAAPAHVEHWLDGAEAEKRTAKQLRPLLRKAGWSAVHDRASRYGNRDHIVVGPSGVYLLDTKAPGGIVTVEDGTMTVRRREDPDDLYTQRSLAGQIKGAAAELAEDLARTTDLQALGNARRRDLGAVRATLRRTARRPLGARRSAARLARRRAAKAGRGASGAACAGGRGDATATARQAAHSHRIKPAREVSRVVPNRSRGNGWGNEVAQNVPFVDVR